MDGDLWDVVVVGAGPAGCAAATAAVRARPGCRVLVVDRAEFPRDKPCGDGIAAPVIDTAAALGLDSDSLVAGYLPLDRFRVVSPSGIDVARTMRRPVWVIPRAVFDARLVAAVQHVGVEVRNHRVRRVRLAADRVVLDETLTARVVIGADGAESAVRRALGVPPNPAGSLAVAVRGYGPELPGQRGEQLIMMGRRRYPAYAWSFPVGDGTANVGYGQLLRTGEATRSDLLSQLHDLIPDVRIEPGTVRGHRLPMSSWRPAIGTGRVLLAGDALSLVNPLTGEGIYYAMVSGAVAGRTAAACGERSGAVYRAQLGRRLGRYLRHSSALARTGPAPWLVDATLRAARDDQGTFDDLVDLALHDGFVTRRLAGRTLRALAGASR
jgi:menaquinone-9 beta-reductase